MDVVDRSTGFPVGASVTLDDLTGYVHPHLTRIQTIAAVDAVMDLLPGVRLDDDFEPARGLVFRKPAVVPVTWDPV